MKIIKNTVKTLRFQRLDNEGEPILDEPDNIKVEIRKDGNSSIKIIKTKMNGEILWNAADLSWFFTIETADTDNMPLGSYAMYIYETYGSQTTRVYDTEVEVVELFSDPGDHKKHPSPSASLNLYQAAIRADDDSDKRGVFCGTVTNGGSFPTRRPDATPLQNEDYVRPDASSTFPFTIDSVTFTSVRDKCYYLNGSWMMDPGALQDTAETPLADKSVESLSGVSTIQKAVNAENKTAIIDIRDDIVELQNTKVDKDLTHGDIVYSVINGHVANQPISKSAVQNTVAWRGTGGTLNVGTPTANTHAANKKYVDDTLDTKQDKLTAGANVTIDNVTNVISAKDTIYYDGENIQITPDNVISATDTITYVVDNLESYDPYKALSANQGRLLAQGMQSKLTAGDNITISPTNVISAARTEVVDNLNSTDTDKALSAMQGRVLYTTKQDKLPNVVNNRYLHTNAATGALEWAEVSDNNIHYVPEPISSVTGVENNLYITYSTSVANSDSKMAKPTANGKDIYVKAGPELANYVTKAKFNYETNCIEGVSFVTGDNVSIPIVAIGIQMIEPNGIFEKTKATDPEAIARYSEADQRIYPLSGTMNEVYLKGNEDGESKLVSKQASGNYMSLMLNGEEHSGDVAEIINNAQTLFEAIVLGAFQVVPDYRTADLVVMPSYYDIKDAPSADYTTNYSEVVDQASAYVNKYLYKNGSFIDISNKGIPQFATPPTDYTGWDGKSWQYIGTDTTDYHNGALYTKGTKQVPAEDYVTVNYYSFSESTEIDAYCAYPRPTDLNKKELYSDSALTTMIGYVDGSDVYGPDSEFPMSIGWVNSFSDHMKDADTWIPEEGITHIHNTDTTAHQDIRSLITGNYLPLSGGTLTGTLYSGAGRALCNTTNSSTLTISGGSHVGGGANIYLCGTDNFDGQFTIQALGRHTTCNLEGHYDGTLTWAGENVITKSTSVPTLTMRSGWSLVGSSTTAIGKNVYYLNITVKNVSGSAKGSTDCPVADCNGSPWDGAFATCCYEAPSAVIGCVMQFKVLKLRTNGAIIPDGAYIPISGILVWAP